MRHRGERSVTHNLAPIKERLEKVVVIAPPEQCSIYQAMKDDIRTLLAVVQEQESIIASLSFTTPGAA